MNENYGMMPSPSSGPPLIHRAWFRATQRADRANQQRQAGSRFSGRPGRKNIADLESMRRRPAESEADYNPLYSMDGGSSSGGGGAYPTVTAPTSSYSRPAQRKVELQHHGSIQAFNVRGGRCV